MSDPVEMPLEARYETQRQYVISLQQERQELWAKVRDLEARNGQQAAELALALGRNAELEAIEETRHHLRSQLVIAEAKALICQDKQDAAEARAKVLEEALEWYANGNHLLVIEDKLGEAIHVRDLGQHARQALQSVAREEKA